MREKNDSCYGPELLIKQYNYIKPMQENDPMCPVLLIPLCSETTARIKVVRGQERKENVFGT